MRNVFVINTDQIAPKNKTLISFVKQNLIYYRTMVEKNNLSRVRSLSVGKHLTKKYNFLNDAFYTYKTKPVYFKRANIFLLTNVS